jgi:hypothetical protein
MTEIARVNHLVRLELEHAMNKHAAFLTTHHGYAVILEELDELWDAIKQDNRQQALKEAAQVAACAIRFIADLGDERHD